MLLPQPLHAFTDNYIWLMINPENQTAAVVDPGEAAPVKKILEQKQLKLTTILVTHHHFDHSGAARALMQETGAEVIGPKNALFEGAHGVEDGEKCLLKGLDITFSVLEIPGHTLDHVAFSTSSNSPILFCGDTLFTGGCGRVFEGTPVQMLDSLKKLKQLQPKTLIYCGHEYTEANLNFARMVEPKNEALLQRIQEVALKRKANEPTVPSTLEIELKTNPFLRTDSDSVIQAAENYAGKSLQSEVEVFATVRQWKNEL